jgi:DNA repair photolyase
MLTKTTVIYEPQGKAGEYAELAVNIYDGCGHRCKYCYAPAFTHTTVEKFHQPAMRKELIQKVKHDAVLLQKAHEERPVLLCFTCDPYQPVDEVFQITRQVIDVLHANGLNVKILTKGGKHAERDFDLLTGNDWFGVTLTTLDDKLSVQWEPGAALPGERINSLFKAYEKGIKTWVSLEPVLYPEAALEIIKRTHHFVNEFKVGTLNYHPHAKTIDWHKFAVDVQNTLTGLNCQYYLKKDLRGYLE